MKKGIFYSIFSVMLLVACKGNESHTEHDGHQHSARGDCKTRPIEGKGCK